MNLKDCNYIWYGWSSETNAIANFFCCKSSNLSNINSSIVFFVRACLSYDDDNVNLVIAILGQKDTDFTMMSSVEPSADKKILLRAIRGGDEDENDLDSVGFRRHSDG